jgi:hypothetical protein
MRPILLAVALLLTAGCLVRLSPGPYGRPPPPPPPPPAPLAEGQRVVRAKELRAGRVRANIIYAKEVVADDGRVGQVFEGNNKEWERGRTDQKLEAAEIVADVIYVKELRAGWVEAKEIHAKKVRIGRR